MNEPLDLLTDRESRMRTLLKTCSWRILASCTTITVIYALTGTFDAALKIGGVEAFVKTFVYYGHERAWQKLPRGAIRALMQRLGGARDE